MWSALLLVAAAATGPHGRYEGTGGLPNGPVVAEFKTKAGGGVRWKLVWNGGQRSKGQGTLEDHTLSFRDGRWSCQAQFTETWDSFSGTCVEVLQAEARAPLEFPWTGSRVARKR